MAQAKARLLNPPADPPRQSWLSANAPWLCLVAAGTGFVIARPRQIGRMVSVVGGVAGTALKLARSPMVQKAAIAFAARAAARKQQQQQSHISFHS